MAPFFLCGPLAHPPLLAAIFGHAPALAPIRLADWRLDRAAQPQLACPQPVAGASIEGWVTKTLSAEEIARLSFYLTATGAEIREIQDANGTAYRLPLAVAAQPSAAWDAAQWQATQAEVVTLAAWIIMGQMGDRRPEAIAPRYRLILAQAASMARAQAPKTSHLRHRAQAADLEVTRHHTPYANYFAVEEYDFRHRRFDGAMSPQMNRAAFISGDAATVLPYDPKRDRVMVIEQFRVGPYVRGDRNPWLLEAIAGRVDPFETPEDCLRREAGEEAGLAIDTMLPVAEYYPSPGANAEYLYSYVALCDLPDQAAGQGGLEAEAEDIRSHILGWQTFWDMIQTPEVANAPLLLSAYWLAAQRPRLRSQP